ncbi:hypothetical protein HNO88_003257 [Novosphingobium chloroacetimidivorans]|uniref:Uncharacterized protein n=1 Tax=Novosphingobium chloroacetimidivorans TaxID=1428314 RepID=A0A7W7NXY1_9SPHN|nr:hypothetical protein [Novosphingobium chloroacetimidivorans]
MVLSVRASEGTAWAANGGGIWRPIASPYLRRQPLVRPRLPSTTFGGPPPRTGEDSKGSCLEWRIGYPLFWLAAEARGPAQFAARFAAV